MLLRKNVFSLILLAVTALASGVSFKAFAMSDDLEDVVNNLHKAIYAKNEPLALEILRTHGNRINVNELITGERTGETWLHHAAANGLPDLIQELLNRGARIVEDRHGRTPADTAELWEHHDVIPLLTRNSASDRVNLATQGRQDMQRAVQNQGGLRSLLSAWLYGGGVNVGSN